MTHHLDSLYSAAVALARESGKVSTTLLRLRLAISYSRAVELVDQMEAEGLVGPAEGTGPRPLLKKKARRA